MIMDAKKTAVLVKMIQTMGEASTISCLMAGSSSLESDGSSSFSRDTSKEVSKSSSTNGRFVSSPRHGVVG